MHLNAWYRPKEGGRWMHNRALLLGSAKGPGRSISLSTQVAGLEPKGGQPHRLIGDSARRFAGKLNDDQYADLLVRTMPAGIEALGGGAGFDQRVVRGGTKPSAVRLADGFLQVQAIGDVNGDGTQDLIGMRPAPAAGTSVGGAGPAAQQCVVVVLGPLARRGQEQRIQSFEGTQMGWVQPVPELQPFFVGDFDGDNYEDVVTRAVLPPSATDGPARLPARVQDTQFYRGTPNGLTLAPTPPGVSRPPAGGEYDAPNKVRQLLCAGYFDQDRYADLLQRDGTVLHGGPQGPGTRTSAIGRVAGNIPAGCQDVPGADLNGDGADELITADPNHRPSEVRLRLSRPGGYGPVVHITRTSLGLPRGHGWSPEDRDQLGWDVAAADLDNDGYDELLVGYRGYSKPREGQGYFVIPGTHHGPALKHPPFLPADELGAR